MQQQKKKKKTKKKKNTYIVVALSLSRRRAVREDTKPTEGQADTRRKELRHSGWRLFGSFGAFSSKVSGQIGRGAGQNPASNSEVLHKKSRVLLPTTMGCDGSQQGENNATDKGAKMEAI
mmetsp:Transcript_28083/g.61000  ORF Transcript_28083/g.61000 Transcript_28083/m.61000 type:complete len:120 (+) Transcript_28083:73-432(+)